MATMTFEHYAAGSGNEYFAAATGLPIYDEVIRGGVISESNGVITSFGTSSGGPGPSFSWIFTGSFTQSADGVMSGTITGLDVTESIPPYYFPSSPTVHLFTFSDMNLSISTVLQYGNNSTSNFDPQIHLLSIVAGQGADSITGTTTDDTLLGYNGNDTIYGSAAANSATDQGDVILGNMGSDLLYGYGGNDSMVGGSGLVDSADSADTLYGGDGNDDIYGSAGNDAIYGEAGNELIVGGADHDTVTGGTGNDIFVNVLGGGLDTITDFQAGTDIITIERTLAVFDAASALSHASTTASGVFIDFGNGSGVNLTGIALSGLHASDFYFYG